MNIRQRLANKIKLAKEQLGTKPEYLVVTEEEAREWREWVTSRQTSEQWSPQYSTDKRLKAFGVVLVGFDSKPFEY